VTPAKLARAEFEQKKITTFSITSSPRKIKHVRFYQHSETVPDRRSCRWAEASQVTEVFHSNPDRNKKCKKLPNSADHPSHYKQKRGIPTKVMTAHIPDREYQILWCLSMSCALQVNKQNSRATTFSSPIAVSTPQATLTASKIITRKAWETSVASVANLLYSPQAVSDKTPGPSLTQINSIYKPLLATWLL
jgi:hypothetical protein